jgi:hypothetical protein
MASAWIPSCSRTSTNLSLSLQAALTQHQSFLFMNEKSRRRIYQKCHLYTFPYYHFQRAPYVISSVVDPDPVDPQLIQIQILTIYQRFKEILGQKCNILLQLIIYYILDNIFFSISTQISR